MSNEASEVVEEVTELSVEEVGETSNTPRSSSEVSPPIEIKVHRVNGKIVMDNRTEEEKAAATEKEKPAVATKKNTTVVVDENNNVVEVVKETAKKEHKPKSGTKLEKALELYKNLTDRSRKNVIAVFVKELNMTPAGASTYQHTCKKQLGE